MSFPEQPFGFVAGRWVRSIGDTPDDPDRAPDYVPVGNAKVVFTPQVTHRVSADGSGWAGIIKDRVMGGVGERGQLIDAEGHDHLALAVGVYSVSYDFGPGKSWPSHYIEVKPEHTAEAPLWLPPIAPPPKGPMIENRVVTIPADGGDGQVLVWDGAGFSWEDPPKGDPGLDGDIFPVHRDTWSGTLTLGTLSRTHVVTLTGDVTITLDPQSPDWSGTITLDITQDATGGHTLDLPGVASAWAVGIVPHPDPTSRSIIHLMWTGTTWVGMVAATNVGIPSGGGV